MRATVWRHTRTTLLHVLYTVLYILFWLVYGAQGFSLGQALHIGPFPLRFVSSTFYISQILVQSHFELVESVLALEATEPVSETVTQMAVELINNRQACDGEP